MSSGTFVESLKSRQPPQTDRFTSFPQDVVVTASGELPLAAPAPAAEPEA